MAIGVIAYDAFLRWLNQHVDQAEITVSESSAALNEATALPLKGLEKLAKKGLIVGHDTNLPPYELLDEKTGEVHIFEDNDNPIEPFWRYRPVSGKKGETALELDKLTELDVRVFRDDNPRTVRPGLFVPLVAKVHVRGGKALVEYTPFALEYLSEGQTKE